MHVDILSQISIAIVAATLVALAARGLRQPLILGYIGAGILIGPTEGFGWIKASEIEPISELGLILLLFMIGLEIDLKKIGQSGRALVAAGVGQFVICFVVGLGFWSLVSAQIGGTRYATVYLAIAASLSSTMIVVKLLYDKFELDTAAGRLSLGVLVFQDIWAILFLAIQRDLSNPEVTVLLASVGKGVCLVLFGLLVSRNVLPALFRSIAKVPELMVIGALGWCFGMSLLASALNLSREMGALIAGISLSTFPYNMEVVGKVVSLRDFFITLFFVTLGAQIARPDPTVLWLAILGSLFVVVSRFVSVTPILVGAKAGARASVVTAINLSQVSEFALVICTLGVAYGHISDRVLSLVVMMLVITSVLSTYMIQYNYELFDLLHTWSNRIGIKVLDERPASDPDEPAPDIIFLGFTRAASTLLHELLVRDPKLASTIVVVDFNPVVHEELTRRGVRAIYGDVSHSATLHHAGVESAKLLLSTVPDAILKGTSNARLLRQLKLMAPTSKIIVTADVFEDVKRVYREGAAFVFVPRLMSSRDLADAVGDALHGDLEPRRRAAQVDLDSRAEVLP